MKFNVRHGGFTLILLLLGLPAYAGGGGGGTSLIEPLGAMLLAAAVVAIILSYAKQASLFAFIIVGVFGWNLWCEGSHQQRRYDRFC